MKRDRGQQQHVAEHSEKGGASAAGISKTGVR